MSTEINELRDKINDREDYKVNNRFFKRLTTGKIPKRLFKKRIWKAQQNCK